MSQRPLLALGLRVAAAMVFATLLALVKLSSESGVALPEIMFWRQAVVLPVLLGWLAATGGLHRLKTRRIGAHAGRAGIGMFSMIFNFGAPILLPLAESTTLGFTTPLFAVLIAGIILRQHVGPWRWTAVALGFAGVLIIAQPGGGEPISHLGAASGLIAALFVAVINFQIRDLGRTEEPITTVFWFAAFGTPMAALALPFFITPHDGYQWLLLIGIGLCGTLGQLLLTASLRYGAVASIVTMDYTALVWATLYGWLVWDRLPTASTWFGAPLIVAAGIVIAWREHRLSRQTVLAS